MNDIPVKEELSNFFHWYELANYLKRDERGFLAVPWELKDGAPDWCESTLKEWKEQKAKGFKVP